MKYLNLTKSLAIVAMFSLIFGACKKTKEIVPLGDAGTTLVKILGGSSPASVYKNAIDFVAVPKQLLVMELRRDIPNETELNKTMVVTVKDDTAAVRAANPSYVQMPTAWYTLQMDGVKTGGQGGTFTFTFKPGEFSKEVYITVPNATLLNPSSLYGLGFTVMTADAGGVISTQKSVVIEIGAKNDWDGIYENTFTNYHPTLNAGYTGDKTDIHFVTTGANTVDMYWPDAGAFANPAILSGSLSYFGAQIPRFTINTATNIVTVSNSGGTLVYAMSLAQVNRYEPSSKTFFVRWGYSYAVPGVFDASCREWTQVIKYKGPR